MSFKKSGEGITSGKPFMYQSDAEKAAMKNPPKAEPKTDSKSAEKDKAK